MTGPNPGRKAPSSVVPKRDVSDENRMAVFHCVQELQAWLRECRAAGESVGLVPTMGALHAGHLSLVKAASSVCQRAIATIFVNPTQFGPDEDLDRYPRTYAEDLQELSALGVDAVFAPSPETMYPAGFSTYVDPPQLASRWEGACRPDHFRGVATVVMKLFQLIPADAAFFGEKDYQQCRVIETVCRDLNVPIAIHRCATVREPDGLALSSRNQYLSLSERQRAAVIAQSMAEAVTLAAAQMPVKSVEEAVREKLVQGGVDRIDYAAIVDAETLEPLSRWGEGAGRLLIAAYVGRTRLIDNCEIGKATL